MNRQAWLLIGAFLLGAALMLPLGMYVAGGSHLIDTLSSPDGQERVEFYSPPRWRSLLFQRGDLPAWARLTRVRDSSPLGDSDVFDLSDQGHAIWSGKKVQIGASAVFDHGTGRWTVIQE